MSTAYESAADREEVRAEQVSRESGEWLILQSEMNPLAFICSTHAVSLGECR